MMTETEFVLDRTAIPPITQTGGASCLSSTAVEIAERGECVRGEHRAQVLDCRMLVNPAHVVRAYATLVHKAVRRSPPARRARRSRAWSRRTVARALP